MKLYRLKKFQVNHARFLTHTVQMKLLKTGKREITLEDFLTHTVQMKPDVMGH